MRDVLSQSNNQHMSMGPNGTSAQANGPFLDVTPESATTSPVVPQDAAQSHADDGSDITDDQPETNDDAPDVAEDVDVMHLSPKMHQALELLFAGQSAAAVARAVGVHRHTIARWRTNHAAFIAAYNRRRSESADDLTRRITGLLDTALANVERHIGSTKKQPSPEQIRASLRLISTLSRSRRVFAVGPTDPYAVLDQMIRHDRYLSDRHVHTFIDDKTRASYITTYTMRLTDEAPDCELPFAPKRRVRKGNPRELPKHPWDQTKKEQREQERRQAAAS